MDGKAIDEAAVLAIRERLSVLIADLDKAWPSSLASAHLEQGLAMLDPSRSKRRAIRPARQRRHLN